MTFTWGMRASYVRPVLSKSQKECSCSNDPRHHPRPASAISVHLANFLQTQRQHSVGAPGSCQFQNCLPAQKPANEMRTATFWAKRAVQQSWAMCSKFFSTQCLVSAVSSTAGALCIRGDGRHTLWPYSRGMSLDQNVDNPLPVRSFSPLGSRSVFKSTVFEAASGLLHVVFDQGGPSTAVRSSPCKLWNSTLSRAPSEFRRKSKSLCRARVVCMQHVLEGFRKPPILEVGHIDDLLNLCQRP